MTADAAILAAAYGVLGLALAAYLLHLGRRLQALRDEVDALRARDDEESPK